MNETHKQDTFLSLAEVLENASDRCLNAERNLRGCLYKVGEPHSLALGEMAANERDLAELLSAFAKNAPEHVLETRFQYTLDTVAHPEPEDPFEAARYLIDNNERIVEELRGQARNATPERVVEALDVLWREVEAKGRRISMIHVTMQDV
ncbi:MAG: hypothetical protein P8Y92_00875 [Halioglobus sp.]|jgi:hypothetical protein